MITFVDAETKTRRTSGIIPLHGEAGFAGMRKAGNLTAQALDLLVDRVKPGVTTAALDRMAYEFACDNGAIPATIFYKGYRHSICTSINHVVCHGIPDERPLREGDIVNIDISVFYGGMHGACADGVDGPISFLILVLFCESFGKYSSRFPRR